MDESRPRDPDVELMLKFQGGDERAFDELLFRHQKSILNLAYRYVGERSLAEDAAQDIFLKVYRARRSYHPQAKFSTWLYRIAVNHCLNAIRARRAAEATLTDAAASAETNPGGPNPQDDLREEVRRAVDALPENQRMAVILLRFHQFSYEEISESMGLSLVAVKSLLFRARETLKEKLKHLVRPDE
ncbi:MAG: sigma-70 family RNA polymerase sigma factor [Planctomycetes bacterium]|nr:sigma-70 family RNA polymerase sigma factor [Planctomycetota bacterium]